MKKSFLKNQKGTTLIEIVIGIAIVSVIALSLYMAMFNVAKLMGNAKQRIGAMALANEQMEIIRNLEYDEVGIQGWVPSGPIVQAQTVTRNNYTYNIDTTIEYVDDAFDGTGAADSIETDYKQAWVTVSWDFAGNLNEVTFVSKFVPDGLESNTGGGVLSVNIIDDAVVPIADAVVNVDSVTDTPAIHGTATTDATGNVRLPGLPAQEYQIIVTKSDYAKVQTYPSPPTSAFNPINANLFVVEGDVVIKTLTMNKSADLTLKAVDVGDSSDIEDIDVDLSGGPEIGTDPSTLTFESQETTDSSGEIVLEGIDPGNYEIVNLAALGNTDYEYIGADIELPIHLDPEDDKEVNLIFAKKNVDSLLVVVKSNVSSEFVEGAEVKITNAGGTFDQSATTSADGRVFFPVVEDPAVLMSTEEYTIEITALNFENYSGTESVDKFTSHDALMTPQ